MKIMGPRKRSQIVAGQRRQEARQTLARVPWPSEAKRAKDRAERVAALTSEERFRAQLDLLRLVEGNPKAQSAGTTCRMPLSNNVFASCSSNMRRNDAAQSPLQGALRAVTEVLERHHIA